MTKLTSVLIFAAIAGMSIVSAVSIDATTYNPDGVWYVVGQDMESQLNLQCWDALIETRQPGLYGKGVTHFTDSRGERQAVEFKFWNVVPTPGSLAIIGVGRKTRHGYGSKGNMRLSLIDDNTMILHVHNMYKIKKLKFKYVILSRNPTNQLELSGYPFKTVDNSCAIF